MRVRTAVAWFSILALPSFALLATLVEPAGAGGGGYGGPCAGVTRGAEISMQDFCFEGAAHVAEPGSTLTVTNHGQVVHDFTAADRSFASGPLEPGDSFSVTVGESGVLPFYCTLHGSASGSGMAGLLVVGDAAGGAVGASAGTPTASSSVPVQARSTASGASDRGPSQRSAEPIVVTAAANHVPSYLSAAALLVAALALGVAVALVRPRPAPDGRRGSEG